MLLKNTNNQSKENYFELFEIVTAQQLGQIQKSRVICVVRLFPLGKEIKALKATQDCIMLHVDDWVKGGPN